MTKDQHMWARIAGFLYLVVVITGMVNLAYVPSIIDMNGSAAQTTRNIMAHMPMFRLGIAAGLICYLTFLLLPLAFYRLLRPVHAAAATLMVVFAIVSVPISLLSVANKMDILALLSTPVAPAAVDVSSQVMTRLASHDAGLRVASLFWGLWLLPLGYLIYKSGFLPRILGILLMLGCFGYLAQVFGRVSLEHYRDYAFFRWATLPASLGEIGTCLWLLIVGLRHRQATA